MGYMTEIGILNDRWDEIRKAPDKFVQEIYESSMSNGRYPSWVTGQTTVARTHHADEPVVYLAWHNSFADIWPKQEADERSLRWQLDALKTVRMLLRDATQEINGRLSKIEVERIGKKEE